MQILLNKILFRHLCKSFYLREILKTVTRQSLYYIIAVLVWKPKLLTDVIIHKYWLHNFKSPVYQSILPWWEVPSNPQMKTNPSELNSVQLSTSGELCNTKIRQLNFFNFHLFLLKYIISCKPFPMQLFFFAWPQYRTRDHLEVFHQA